MTVSNEKTHLGLRLLSLTNRISESYTRACLITMDAVILELA